MSNMKRQSNFSYERIPKKIFKRGSSTTNCNSSYGIDTETKTLISTIRNTPITSGPETCHIACNDPVSKTVYNNVLGRFNKSTVAKKQQYYRCNECKLTLSSQTTLDTHLTGSRHAKKVKELEIKDFINEFNKEYILKHGETDYKCEVCNVLATSLVQIKTHVEGQKHKNKVENYKNKKPIKIKDTSISTSRAFVDVWDPKLDDIEIKTPPAENFPNLISETNTADISNQENESKTAKQNFPFHCDICNVPSNSQAQYDQHISSRKHVSKEKTGLV